MEIVGQQLHSCKSMESTGLASSFGLRLHGADVLQTQPMGNWGKSQEVLLVSSLTSGFGIDFLAGNCEKTGESIIFTCFEAKCGKMDLEAL